MFALLWSYVVSPPENSFSLSLSPSALLIPTIQRHWAQNSPWISVTHWEPALHLLNLQWVSQECPHSPSLPHSASLYQLPSRWQHHPRGQQWGHRREPGATPGEPESRRPPSPDIQHMLHHQFTSLLSSSCAGSKFLADKTSFFHYSYIPPSIPQ